MSVSFLVQEKTNCSTLVSNQNIITVKMILTSKIYQRFENLPLLIRKWKTLKRKYSTSATIIAIF